MKDMRVAIGFIQIDDVFLQIINGRHTRGDFHHDRQRESLVSATAVPAVFRWKNKRQRLLQGIRVCGGKLLHEGADGEGLTRGLISAHVNSLVDRRLQTILEVAGQQLRRREIEGRRGGNAQRGRGGGSRKRGGVFTGSADGWMKQKGEREMVLHPGVRRKRQRVKSRVNKQIFETNVSRSHRLS